jgi:hypothetical protein
MLFLNNQRIIKWALMIFSTKILFIERKWRGNREATIVTNVSVAVGNTIKELFNLRNVQTINNTVDTGLFNYEDSDNKTFRFIHVSTLTESQRMLEAF